MTFKKLKSFIAMFVVATFIMPQSILAYSNKIIAGGETIGIEIKTKGVMITGFYDVDDNRTFAKLKKGDMIIKADNKEINDINDFIEIIKNSNQQNLKLTCKDSNNNTYSETINLVNKDGVIKTGLYVKDTISGIGTLSFIDPKTKLYGALGHEISNSINGVKVDIKDGKIYESNITSIDKSVKGEVGSKRATTNENKIFGDINENTSNGIFGRYSSELNNNKLYEVGDYKDISLGKASLITVVNKNEKKEYDIEILKKNNNKNDNKNILFKITDEELINKTGGVVQGMSGSPIVQNGKIIGAVTNAVINDPKKGYAILITTMLEESEN